MTSTETATTRSNIPHQWQTRVCLRSNEGFPYEIDRQILIDSSAFFADLFDLPWHLAKKHTPAPAASGLTREAGSSDSGAGATDTTSLTLDEVIDIDLTTKDLKLFFGFMQVTARFQFLVRYHGLDLDCNQVRFLYPLVDQYECEGMRIVLDKVAASLAMFNPWEIFRLACDRDDLGLGKTAISYLYPQRLYSFVGSERSTDGWTGLSKLSEAWKAEFLRLLLRGSPQHDTILLMEIDPNNDDWAQKFNPDGCREDSDANGKRKRL